MFNIPIQLINNKEIIYLWQSGISFKILLWSFQYSSMWNFVVSFLSGAKLADKSGNIAKYSFVIANISFGA